MASEKLSSLNFYVLCIGLLFCQSVIPVNAQQKYKTACIAFYNLENLFDTLDTPNVNDEEFTPAGDKKYDSRVYLEKLHNLSYVISKLGTTITPDGPALLGVAEIENAEVLRDLAAHPHIAHRKYDVVHYHSPDRRGVDVALLYQPKYFKVLDSESLEVLIYNESGGRIYTRDILYVKGLLDGDTLHVMVNHWPSRRGGEKRSSHLREAAAAVARKKVDEVLQNSPKAKIIIMGDLNDDPTNTSVTSVLLATGEKAEAVGKKLYNPFYSLYKKGLGTLAWQDAWNLFDQIILSSGLLDEKQNGYYYYQAKVFNESFLMQNSGRFKGYPWRTYVGNTYAGGYSDHFPTYIILAKPVNSP